jgi:hypothetical protein
MAFAVVPSLATLAVVACSSLDDAGPTGLAGSSPGTSGAGGTSSTATTATGSTTASAGSGMDSGFGGSGGAAGSPTSGDDASSPEASTSADASGEAPRDASPESTKPDATSSLDSGGPCVTMGTELCDDFESGAIDPQKWKIVKPTASAMITVDDVRPHTGKYSLHIRVVPGQTSTAQIADAITFPAASNTFYTRAYMFVSPDLPADNNGGYHTAYLLATGNNDLGFVEAGLASAGNKQWLGYSEYYGSGPDNHAHGATFTEFGPRSNLQVTPMKWICMELMQGGNATTTMRRVWIDGNELPEQMSNLSDRKPPAFSLMSIGVLEYHPTPILSDVWIDDVRVSKQHIGCDL